MTILVRSGVVAASRRYALELVRPSSIAFAGGGSETASIVGLGSVDFSAVTSLSLNGVFSAEYDNYMVSVRSTASIDQSMCFRNRSSGTDATGTNYVRQGLSASSTSVTGARDTSQTFALIGASGTAQRNGLTLFVYGPNLAQPTAMRSVTAVGIDNARISDQAATHSLSTSYDGCTLFMAAGDMTGNVAVYGLRG